MTCNVSCGTLNPTLSVYLSVVPLQKDAMIHELFESIFLKRQLTVI